LALLRTIVIVGGGFSGTIVAANLLRRPPAEPTRIVLVERSPHVGRGVAYARRPFPYLLNVPAGRMSATSAAPREFFEFVARRIPKATPEDFLPRTLYGDYLEEVLLAAEVSAPRNVRLDIWQGTVQNVRRLERHLPLQVELDDGRSLTADDVVIAAGNPRPAPLARSEAVATHPAYIADPWQQTPAFSCRHEILIVGTGLTRELRSWRDANAARFVASWPRAAATDCVSAGSVQGRR
jgi:uncharacterized NAD(P)/FAD-binding protein YdhS